jgi:hypothetical protein
MEEMIKLIGLQIIELYKEFISFFPSYVGNAINFLILVLLIVLYAILIWKAYKFISRKNLLNLELKKYNKFEYPFSVRLVASALYFLEYIIILPILVLISFIVLTFFLVVLSQDQEISKIFVISAVVISAIRMTSYYKEEIAQEIAKFLPMTLLAVAILNPKSFSQTQYFSNAIIQITQIPSLIGQVGSYLLMILILEITLRFFDSVFFVLKINDEEVTEEEFNI